MTVERVESAYSASTRGIILAYRPISHWDDIILILLKTSNCGLYSRYHVEQLPGKDSLFPKNLERSGIFRELLIVVYHL